MPECFVGLAAGWVGIIDL